MSTNEIKKLLGNKKLLIGTDRALKNLKNSKLEKVFLALNCEPRTAEDIKHYAGLCSTKVVQLDISNDELGAVCKKPFSVSVIGILR
ncbi:MAG: ribosomal L7Ae/L30e/S12e/Gadd45 family protein [Nanoarchaeota archaeon]|nr:ribosomal L7Ae/L30e/S12e/Gadd45 family protein [Nanoarchaeota archaeon]MBU1269779.1 ribosomal L7Ae/L30e/S12e/Gadd45 family protein [Nanoarchaeota archaeon]MBU1604371.1 ribosomal L7Ae/L30e/S12e/Gadd45 family protein [Nanoarchaeota archaeon]MBU2443644.1 ribosomal L7Ae/L30e/S12e/Gadd45 family protein [Nanoarchaeota archaeon]